MSKEELDGVRKTASRWEMVRHLTFSQTQSAQNKLDNNEAVNQDDLKQARVANDKKRTGQIMNRDYHNQIQEVYKKQFNFLESNENKRYDCEWWINSKYNKQKSYLKPDLTASKANGDVTPSQRSDIGDDHTNNSMLDENDSDSHLEEE